MNKSLCTPKAKWQTRKVKFDKLMRPVLALCVAVLLQTYAIDKASASTDAKTDGSGLDAGRSINPSPQAGENVDFLNPAMASMLGSREAPAPIVGRFESEADRLDAEGPIGGVYDVRVVVGDAKASRTSEFLSAKSPELTNPLPLEAAEVGELIVRQGGTIISITESKGYATILAMLPSQALSWVRMNASVAQLERRSMKEMSGVAMMSPEFGSAPEESDPEQKSLIPGVTHTRVLLNGFPIGIDENARFSSNDVLPYLQQGRMMSSSETLGRAFDYLVSVSTVCGAGWPGADGRLCGPGASTPNRMRVTLDVTSPNTFGMRQIQFLEGASTARVLTRGNVRSQLNIQTPAVRITPGGRRLLMVPADFTALHAGAKIREWDVDTNTLQLYYYENLQSNGLYFIGREASNTGTVGAQKLNFMGGTRVPNAFYDPAKPTVIYAHGWNKNAIRDGAREGLFFNENGVQRHVQNNWIDGLNNHARYNVGIYQWPQYSDDDTCGNLCPEPRRAEAKIYAFQGLDWKSSTGAVRTDNVSGGQQNVPIAEQYAVALAPILADGRFVWLIGNSLGGQLTLNAAALAGRRPARISFMDPYWSPGDDRLGARGFTQQRMPLLLNSGVPMETFYSSAAGGTAGFNKYVWDNTAGRQAYPSWAGFFGVGTKHVQHTRIFMWSLGCRAMTNSSAFVGRAHYDGLELFVLSANAYWEQTAGMNTIDPCDDSYTKRTVRR